MSLIKRYIDDKDEQITLKKFVNDEDEKYEQVIPIISHEEVKKLMLTMELFISRTKEIDATLQRIETKMDNELINKAWEKVE